MPYDLNLTLERTLHEGQFMRVEQCICPEAQERVTRKVLTSPSPLMYSRFMREGQIAQRLEHPNIVRCWGVWEQGIVYEYLEGMSLREALHQHKRFSEREALRITRSILSGVAYAHARGILHLDLKPDNVMLCGEGHTVKIIDFGLAKDINLSNITREGDRLGTPHYMAPEQFQGQRCEPRSDLFSVGAMLFELISGKPPFANPFGWLCGRAQRGPIQTHPALERLIAWTLEPDPLNRPSSALDTLIALESVMDELGQNDGGSTVADQIGIA